MKRTNTSFMAIALLASLSFHTLPVFAQASNQIEEVQLRPSEASDDYDPDALPDGYVASVPPSPGEDLSRSDDPVDASDDTESYSEQGGDDASVYDNDSGYDDPEPADDGAAEGIAYEDEDQAAAVAGPEAIPDLGDDAASDDAGAPGQAETVAEPQPVPMTVGLVSAAHPEAAEAGMRMLRNGGSAVDAALATMLALTVVEPQSSGIGGGGFLLSYDAASDTLSTIDGRETAPARVNEGLFLDAEGNPLPFRSAFSGGKSVGVPGNIRLMAMAHEKWGKLPWKDLFLPAIQLADGGYEISASLAERLEQMRDVWQDFPAAQSLFWEDGQPVPEGTLVYNPALAATLQRMADLGPDAFYAGQTAQEMVRAVRSAPVNPGQLDLIDLSAYAAKERPPVCLPYRTYRVCGMGPPSSGATTVLQILGLLERFDMPALGPQSLTSWHLLAEAMRLAYADRDKYLGDADFVPVPVEGLLEPAYLKKRSALISKDKARSSYEAGMPKAAEPRTEPEPVAEEGTSHFVAVDMDGNVASMTSTIEGPFGSQLVAAGFFLNNELTDFSFMPMKDEQPVANRVQPGKRPLSSMSPTVVFNAEGRPVLAIGSAGGRRIIMHVAKTLVGVLDFDMPLEQAMALPNIFFEGEELIIEADSGLATVAEEMAKLGHVVTLQELPSKLNAASWSEELGWRAAADPRSEGVGKIE